MKIKSLIAFCKSRSTSSESDRAVFKDIMDVLIMADKFDLFPREVPAKVYQQFVEVYFDFRRERGANPKMNPAAGKALKEIIRYLLKNEKVNGDPDQALVAWRFMLDRWNHLSDYIKAQVGLTQINKNIEEIIEQLTHASKKAKQQHNQSEKDKLRDSIRQRRQQRNS